MQTLQLRKLVLTALVLLNQSFPLVLVSIPGVSADSRATVKASESSVPPDQEFEITSLRTETSKTFSITKDGVTTKRLEQVSYPLHYLDENHTWQDVDPHWHKQADGSFSNIKNSFQSFVPAQTTERTTAKTQKGDFWTEVTVETTGEIPAVLTATGNHERVVYPGAYKGLDIAFGLEPDRLVKEFVFTSPPESIPELSFILRLPEGTTAQLRGNSVVFLQNEVVIGYTPAPFLYQRDRTIRGWMMADGGVVLQLEQLGHNQYRLTKQITEEGAAWLRAQDRQFPVAIDATINVQVTASGNDGDTDEGADNANSLTRTILPIGSYSGVAHMFVTRFPSISIPNAETIISAEFSMANNGTYDCGSCTLAARLYLEDADTATAPTLTNMNDLTTTTAYTDIDISSMTADTFVDYDVTTAVQEVIDRAGWSSGNALSVIAVDNGSDYSEWQEPWSYDGSATYAPTLVIEYGSTASLQQEGYRWRDDNASESSGWLASEDTAITQPIETITRLRTLINATDDPSSAQFRLEYKLSSDSDYTPVGPTPKTATPVVESRSVGRTTATNTTTHTITMPSGIQTGDLLLIVFSTDGAPGVVMLSNDWVKLDTASYGTTVTGAIFYKFATGSDSATVFTTAGEQSSHAVLRISGAGIPYAASSNGSSTNSNPPSLAMGAARNHLWVATRSGDSTVVASAAPSGYSNLQSQAAAGTGGASTNTAEYSDSDATEDPGTFTSTTEQWVSYTIGIPPADTVAGIGAIAAAAEGTTSLSVPYPTDIDPGDLLLLTVANKHTPNGPSTPSGWSTPSNYQASGGLGSSGADTGTVYSTVFSRIATGSESGNVSVTITSGNSSLGRIIAVKTRSGKIWSIAAVNGVDATGSSAWSVTAGSDPGLEAGDIVITSSAVNGDLFNVYLPTLTATGITVAGNAQAGISSTTQGNDTTLVTTAHRVVSGTSSAAPVLAMTVSGNNTNNPTGPTIFMRIRQLDAPIILGSSANISASGQSTTAQLTAPSGKSTSDFVTGRMQDDENPADAIDITNDDYTELEWSLQATDQATASSVYHFRVTNNGAALDTYSVTPQWTIGTPAANSTFTQSAYRWYVDSDANNVSDPWGNPNLAENTLLALLPATNVAPLNGSELRLRVAVTIGTDNLAASSQQFKLQYKSGTDGSCTTGSWTDVGASGGGSIWRYATSSVSDGATVSSVVLTGSDVTGAYAKSNPTATNPNSATVGQDIEYDFHIQQNGAGAASLYSFRMVESDGTALSTYSNCPTLSTAQITDQELRHGNVFGNEVERGFTRAD